MKECKRHKWRVGSKNAVLVNGKIKVVSINIWCEGCNKKIKAKMESDIKLTKFANSSQGDKK